MSHLDLTQFQRFCKENLINFYLVLTITLFILLYVLYLFRKQTIQQSKHQTHWGYTCITLYHHLLSLAHLHTCQVRVTVGDSSLLLYLCYVFQALINSFVCWFCMSTLGLILIQICHMKECQSVCNDQCYC